MFDLKKYLKDKQEQINGFIEQLFDKSIENRQIVRAMKHSLMAGGKRIRPILCLASAESVGGYDKSLLHVACTLELIHTYSLIHDDLPAMDDDDLRRGQPTCHVAFDEATAILAGDALLTLAFETLSCFPEPSANLYENLDPKKWLNVIGLISKAAGYQGMIEGQMRDIQAETTSLDMQQLQEMHALKTGALLEASVKSGAILGGGSEAQIKDLTIYAQNIGLAFQVTDDILNVEGDSKLMGKAVGTDLERNKSTYPALLGLDESKIFASKLINNALKALNKFDNNADPLRYIATYIIERKK